MFPSKSQELQLQPYQALIQIRQLKLEQYMLFQLVSESTQLCLQLFSTVRMPDDMLNPVWVQIPLRSHGLPRTVRRRTLYFVLFS